jgi:hypothetical protein
MGINYSDSSLRVETLSFEEAADFNPQEWSIWFMTFRSALVELALEAHPPSAKKPCSYEVQTGRR